MAAKPAFSKEQLNFFKLSTLVLDEFPKVLRKIFITMWHSKVAAIRPGFIVWDDSVAVRNMLLASEGGKTDIPTSKSIKEWDCTALFKATIYAKTFGAPSSKGSTLNNLYLKKSKPAPGSFHSSVQSSTGDQDETYALAIDQLRLLRNTLCHSPKSGILKSDFDYYVVLVNDALTAMPMNIDTSFVDDIGKMSEDDFPTDKVNKLEETRVMELQAMNRCYENMGQTLSSVKECTENMNQLTKKMRTMMKGEHDNRTNKEEQPTRSCLPEKLPKEMFTSREAEMQKVVSSLKDEEMAVVSLHGGPGFGKTAIAVEVSHKLSCDHKIRVIFSNVSRATTVDEVILLLCRDVRINHENDARSSLIFWLKDIKYKVIFVLEDIDNLLIEKTDFYDFINLLRKSSNQRCQIVTTARTSYVIPELLKLTVEVQVNEMDDKSCVELLTKNCSSKQDNNFLLQLAKLCGNIPLAMCIAGSRVDHFKNSEELLQCLEKQPMEVLESPKNNQYVSRAINMSYKILGDEKKRIFVRLAVFEGSFSEEAAGEVIERDLLNTKRIMEDLVARSLIKQPEKHRYSIHHLIKHFLNDQAESKEKKDAERLMVEYYLKLGNDLTIKSYSKNEYKVSRQELMKEAHNIQNVLEICYQQKNSSSEITRCLVNSDIYTTSSSRLFSIFVRTIMPGSTVDEFLQQCSKLAEERKQHRIKITFDCLLADQERIKSIGKSDNSFNIKMDAIKKEFEMHYEDVKEDKAICAHYYYQYSRYLLRKSEKETGKKRLVLRNDALKQLKMSLGLRRKDTSVKRADIIFSFLHLGNVLKKIASVESERASKSSWEEAQKYYEEAIKLSKRELGEHDLTSMCYKNLADLLLTTKEFERAEENYVIAKEMREDLALDVNERHVFLLNNLGLCLTKSKRARRAISILERACDMAEKLAEGELPTACMTKVYASLAFAYNTVGSRIDAVKYAKKALANKEALAINKSDIEELEKIIQKC